MCIRARITTEIYIAFEFACDSEELKEVESTSTSHHRDYDFSLRPTIACSRESGRERGGDRKKYIERGRDRE